MKKTQSLNWNREIWAIKIFTCFANLQLLFFEKYSLAIIYFHHFFYFSIFLCTLHGKAKLIHILFCFILFHTYIFSLSYFFILFYFIIIFFIVLLVFMILFHLIFYIFFFIIILCCPYLFYFLTFKLIFYCMFI